MTDTPPPASTPTKTSRTDKRPAIELLLRAVIFASFVVIAISMFSAVSTGHYVKRFDAIEVGTSTPSDFTGVIGRLTDFPVERSAFVSDKDASNPLAGLACAKGRDGGIGFWSVDAKTGGAIALTAFRNIGDDDASRLGVLCKELISRIPSI